MSKNYLIVGGEFENKGAEAMTFITIQHIREINNNSNIYMLLGEEYINNSLLELCGIKGIPDRPAYRMYAAGGVTKFIPIIRRKNISKGFYELNNILKIMDVIIDISGYGFTSVWGIIPTLSSCLIIKAAKKNGISYYMMPQSFGPFDYPVYIKNYMCRKIKKSLKWCKHIYTRENEGYMLLTQVFNLTNVEMSFDMVLQSKNYNPDIIFKKNIRMFKLKVTGKYNVAIVPNVRNCKYAIEEKILKFYENLINFLLKSEYKIYIISHSAEDNILCERIKTMYISMPNVNLVNHELSCIEYQNNIKKFDFCIASRFHSIIHAYKVGIPCVVLGWATKYRELLRLYEQEQYLINIQNIGDKDYSYICENIIKELDNEKNKIIEKTKLIQQYNCLDIIT